MTGGWDSHLLLINPIPDGYTCPNKSRYSMHIVKLIERRFPKQKGNIASILWLIALVLLLLGLRLMFLREEVRGGADK